MSVAQKTTDTAEPSWWKYVAGSDADKKWAAFYAETVANGGTISERDTHFYLKAILRAVADSPPATGRPLDPINFWLTCRYQLGIEVGVSPKSAALDTAEVATKVGKSQGHSYKKIQEHAKKLDAPAREFLDAIHQSLLARAPEELLQLPSKEEINKTLILWIENMVRKVV